MDVLPNKITEVAT